mmetsp:Transcript_62679/g.198481  ORF Transcript_62679/g.198481 Transcript_62679/m.198481 type:complete len:305 (-) Transcript_62679:870-1784(-)
MGHPSNLGRGPLLPHRPGRCGRLHRRDPGRRRCQRGGGRRLGGEDECFPARCPQPRQQVHEDERHRSHPHHGRARGHGVIHPRGQEAPKHPHRGPPVPFGLRFLDEHSIPGKVGFPQALGGGRGGKLGGRTAVGGPSKASTAVVARPAAGVRGLLCGGQEVYQDDNRTEPGRQGLQHGPRSRTESGREHGCGPAASPGPEPDLRTLQQEAGGAQRAGGGGVGCGGVGIRRALGCPLQRCGPGGRADGCAKRQGHEAAGEWNQRPEPGEHLPGGRPTQGERKAQKELQLAPGVPGLGDPPRQQLS